MNRLLLKECLDELRSDDLEELTESQKHPHGKKRNSPHHGNRAAPSLDGSSRGFPDSSRSTASSTPALTERRRQSIANVTNDVKRKILNYLNGDRKIDEKDYKRAIGDLRATFSLEYKGGSSYGPIATPSGIMGLRVADHRAVGEHFPQNEGDFYVSIYIGEGEAAHIPTAVPYKEFYCPKVLFDRNPKKVLRAAVGIVLNAIETGELVDKTATFTMKDYPVEVPQGAQAAIPTQAGLSPQPPATPPTEPGVQEAFFSRFSNLDYLYRILDEGKDRLIDRLPSLDDAQKAQMKQFFAKRPSLESKFDWNRPDTITWDAFQSIANEYEDPIDPDTVPEFSDKRDEGDGIVSYEVQDDRAGQYAVRRIVDTHWGADANPWCLITKGMRKHTKDVYQFYCDMLANGGHMPDGGWEEIERMYADKTGKNPYIPYSELDAGWDYWEDYAVLPKRIAFKDGKLLAFMANDFNPYYNMELRDSILREHPEYNKEFAVYRMSNDIPLRNAEKQFLEWLELAHPEYKIKHLEKWWDRNDRPHPSVHDCA